MIFFSALTKMQRLNYKFLSAMYTELASLLKEKIIFYTQCTSFTVKRYWIFYEIRTYIVSEGATQTILHIIIKRQGL